MVSNNVFCFIMDYLFYKNKKINVIMILILTVRTFKINDKVVYKYTSK